MTETLIPPDLRPSFSELISYVLAVEPTSEADLARRCGISRQRVNMYVAETRIAPLAVHVPAIAEGLRVSVAVVRDAIFLSQTRASEKAHRRAMIRAYRKATSKAAEGDA